MKITTYNRQIQKLRSNGKPLDRVQYFMLYTEEDGKKKIKYSQPIKPWHFLYSFSLIDEHVEEVVVRCWLDENKVAHWFAKWDKDKIYIQSTTVFQAGILFKKFVDEHLKLQNEKEKAENQS